MKVTIDTKAETIFVNSTTDLRELIDFVNNYGLLNYKLIPKDLEYFTFTSPFDIREHKIDFDYNDSITKTNFKPTV